MNVLCIVPLSPVRFTPDHRVEMSSQLLFGETAEALESNEGWLYIKHDWDGYLGWCRENQFVPIENPFEITAEYTGDWVDEIFINDQKLMIPFGSDLSLLKNNLPGIKIEFSGNIYNAGTAVISDKKIVEIASIFLNSTYLWGSRSVFGIDCSGFVQSVYKMFNVPLLRDARNQVEQGLLVGGLDEVICGDLAFFEEGEGHITHVGILLSNDRIIHSSGNVRIDTIDNEGIIHSGTGKRTHKLKIIKRILT